MLRLALPLLALLTTPAQAAPGQGWVVLLEDGTDASALAETLGRVHGFVPEHVYEHAIDGFAFHGAPATAKALRGVPGVVAVDRDVLAEAWKPKWCEPGSTHPACDGGGDDDGGDTGTSSQITPWGVTRVGGPLGASSATAWVLDTGVDLDHPDLVVDASRSANFSSFGPDDADDHEGHGTFVAGILAAIDNDREVVGVAAGTTIVSVRVLGPSGRGRISDIVAGLDYVAANGASGDVANLSLGASGHIASLHAAVEGVADAGIRVAIAAGNSGSDADDYEPAHVEHANVWTTSASDASDCLASWSNWGNPPVDFAAPGVSITSLERGGGTRTGSGTSASAPHVAGLLLFGTPSSDGTVRCDPDGDPDPIAVH